MNAQDQQNSDRIVRNIDYLQVLKNRWKEVFLVFLLVLVISVVVTFLMPPSYRATSQFQIKLPKPVMEIGQGGDVVASSNVTANYIPMQYSVLTSTEVLKVVSRKLNLAAEWGMTDEMAASNLAGMIRWLPCVRRTWWTSLSPARIPNWCRISPRRFPRLTSRTVKCVKTAWWKPPSKV